MPGSEVRPPRAWDLVRVPFPYTNRSVQQRRPALVVARHDRAGEPALLWVLMVTSAANRGWAGDIEVSDLATAGLPAPSVVRTAKLATIDAGVAERLGTLPDADRDQVTAALRLLLSDIL